MAFIPYAFAFWRVQMEGTVAEGSDTFSASFHMVNSSADAPDPTAGDTALFEPPISTWFQDAGTGIAGACALTGLRISKILASGDTNDLVTQNGTFANGTVGANSNVVTPDRALAVQYKSDLTRGPGAWGRFMVPQYCGIVQTNGHLTSTQTSSIATTTKTMFDAINTAFAGHNIRIGIASHGHRTRTNPGQLPAQFTYANPVNTVATRIFVGDVISSIDRRRNNLKPTYSISQIA